MLGVWAAFWLTGLSEQKAQDIATKQRLHLVVLESQYNGVIAKEIMDNCANFGTVTIYRLDATLATAALDDTNIIAFLPHHKASMLRSYVNAVATLNEAIHAHQTTLESTGYRQTPTEVSIRENLRSNAAAVIANIIVLREELSPYFDKTSYDHGAMRRAENRIKYLKAKALRGEVHLSKDE